MPSSTADIRKQFIEFFENRCQHTAVQSSSVIPHDDPTLLFTNAGMNQFKDVFLGLGTRPYVRAVNTQKCIRAGGKHNDLEDVGRDTYHHTFFEMLGNWSFGDYFKAEAISWAWELMTEVWGLDKSRLYVTVFEGNQRDGLEPDDEAKQLWETLTDIDPTHISSWGKKDNFWEMGNTGPCGPCSEIHYDSTPNGDGGHLVNKDNPSVIELWNLVFIQFYRGDDGALTQLPNKHVDTGMGLERVARVIQGKSSNYDTDLWQPIFKSIESITGARPYNGELENHIDIAYRVLADHARCLVVALADGGRPGAAGREYVLRRILRRGVRHACQTLGVSGPLLCKLVPSVVETLGETFPEIKSQASTIETIIQDEEESFLKTLDRGLELFAKAANEGGGTCIDAKSAFELHDTFGFPIDLTEVMAEEQGITVDRAGYEKLMETARETSRGTSEVDKKMLLPPKVLGKLETIQVHPTDDSKKYESPMTSSTVKAIWNGKDLVDKADNSEVFGVILDKTPFYAEAGGQVGDTGHIIQDASLGRKAVAGMGGEPPQVSCQFNVEETHRFGEYVLHIGRCGEGLLHCGDQVTASVQQTNRNLIESNHTSTHVLNLALRSVLGDEVGQRGSLVNKDHLRFDFSHPHALTEDEVSQVETIVNNAIENNLCVDAKVVPLQVAQSIHGVRAIFGEQYPDPVRVVSIGATVDELLANPKNEKWYACSVEFCGGTHLSSCASAMHFVVIHEQALASGVRRINALTGVAAKAAFEAGKSLIERIEETKTLEGDALVSAFEELSPLVDEITISQSAKHAAKQLLIPLLKKVKSLQKEASSSRRDQVLKQANAIAKSEGDIVVASIENADKDSMLTALDVVRASRPDGAVMLFGITFDEKVLITAGVGKTMISQGLKAGDWVREAAKVCGGGGGGRPDTAQAGGKIPAKVPEAIDQAIAFAKEATA